FENYEKNEIKKYKKECEQFLSYYNNLDLFDDIGQFEKLNYLFDEEEILNYQNDKYDNLKINIQGLQSHILLLNNKYEKKMFINFPVFYCDIKITEENIEDKNIL